MTEMQSKLENEIESVLRKAFDDMPLIIVEEQAALYKKIINKVCDEYIEKGKAYKEQWALDIVRGMFGNSADNPLETEEK